jgi:paraquat-inducible protein B
MGRKPSKTAIGAFVLGAVGLLIAGVLIFGGGRFFTKQYSFITYFDGSVKGLSVGSPVMFRGVRVGSVTDISIIVVDRKRASLRIPVVFTLEPTKFKGTPDEIQRDPKSIQDAVRKYGLRSQLQSLSFLTGQLMVALDFFPDKPATVLGLNSQYPEIPSVPTSLEELQKKIENLPFKQMVENLNSILAGLNRLLKTVDPQGAGKSIDAAIAEVRALVRHLDGRVDPLVDSVTRSVGAAEATFTETRETVAETRGSLKDILAATRATLDSVQTALKQSEQTLQGFSGDSHLASELNGTLREISATARSLRQLSDYLERHPESLLRGKGRKGD